jgi:exodeoxyribonuclease V beta subunit
MSRFDLLEAPIEGVTLVEASAGTGKTYAIATLFLRLLLERDLAVDEVLVVTFTEAATMELRDRIRRRLRDAVRAFENPAGSEHDPELLRLVARSRRRDHDTQRLSAALLGMDAAAIHTIHGFCQRVLRDSAFDSGVAFETELLTDTSALRDEIVHDFWAREVADAPETYVRALYTAKCTPNSCRSLVDLAVRHPEIRLLPELFAGAERWFHGQPPERAVAQFRRRLIDYARVELERRKSSRGLLSFDDLLQRLHVALRGPGGPALARQVQSRYPAALIDEFQDTDPIQYAIFDAIYGPRPRSLDETRTTLFLIGDPKQAIYAFRGADVFAYMAAARRVPDERRLTMDVNWRSDPALVEAMQLLVRGLEKPFLLEGIGLPKVTASRTSNAFQSPNGDNAALEILFVRGEDQGLMNMREGDRLVPGLVAAEISSLLRNGATLDGRRIAPGDIAVLTRTNMQAFDVQQALNLVNVPSVVMGDSSVFERPEAAELQRVLSAVADPSDTQALRAALTSELVGVTASALVTIEQDPEAWDSWVNDFRRFNQVWIESGFVQMFRQLLAARGVQKRVLTSADGERRMTNLLHLMELCHAAERSNDLGPAGLVHWLHQQRAAPRGEARDAAQIRLERDEQAVVLLTVHRSKGLEYPIVYCPYLWRNQMVFESEKASVLFHDAAKDFEHVLNLDAFSAELNAHRSAFMWERLAENLRLLYVALTRARHRMTLIWGEFRQFSETALGYALFYPRGRPLPKTNVDALSAPFKRLDSLAMLDRLYDIAEASNGNVSVRVVDAGSHGKRVPLPAEVKTELNPRIIERRIDLAWQTASFSQLAASAEILDSGDERTPEERDHDELAGGSELVVSFGGEAEAGPPIALADFPRGPRAGNFFHEVFEAVDFAEAVGNKLEEVTELKLREYGYEVEPWLAPVCDALRDVFKTPLGAGHGSFALNQIGWEQRLNELEFYLPVADQPNAEGFTRALLAKVFRDHPSPELLPDYAERIERMGFLPLKGWLKGFIDLVFVHEGRYYLADYKTNHLGDTLSAFAPDRLAVAMAHSHYYLQYHLYSVALHRYLERRLPRYEYDRDFGGVYYLFIRGMTHTQAGSGVFHERPPRARIVTLSEQLAKPPASPQLSLAGYRA